MTNNHPANHWTNCLPFPGRESVAQKGKILIHQGGESLGIDNLRWSRFFRTLGLPVTRGSDDSCELNQALVDTLFCDGVEHQVVSNISLYRSGHLAGAKLSAPNLQHTVAYTFVDAIICKMEHKTNGALHRLDGPAVMRWHVGVGTIEKEEHWVDGKRHNCDGPAVVDIFANGSIRLVQHWIDGGKHKLDGPAVVGRFESGAVRWMEYWVQGKIHRLDGAAEFIYHDDGSIWREGHWINGCEVTGDDRRTAQMKSLGEHLSGGYAIKQSRGVVNI